MNNKLYFGHPVSTYNTSKESELLDIIRGEFSEHTIVNPNSGTHSLKYSEYKQKFGNGMLYYFNEVLPQIDTGVFLPFNDGMFGAGVYKEAEFLYHMQREVFEIDYQGDLQKFEPNSTRELSVEKTRKRIY